MDELDMRFDGPPADESPPFDALPASPSCADGAAKMSQCVALQYVTFCPFGAELETPPRQAQQGSGELGDQAVINLGQV